jgi:hypothetical protein
VRGDGCIKASVAPAGFLKVTKEAVDAFMDAYPELCYGPRYQPERGPVQPRRHERLWWGEDYAFCRRYREKCGEVWIQPDLSLTHWMGDKPYPGNFPPVPASPARRQRIRLPHAVGRLSS